MKFKAKKAASIGLLGLGLMYLGDRANVSNTFQGMKDYFFSVETAENFAPYSTVSIESVVNVKGERETYLAFQNDSNTIYTKINNNGYAIPKLDERIENYVDEKKEQLEKTNFIGKDFKDKIELYLKLKLRKLKKLFRK